GVPQLADHPGERDQLRRAAQPYRRTGRSGRKRREAQGDDQDRRRQRNEDASFARSEAGRQGRPAELVTGSGTTFVPSGPVPNRLVFKNGTCGKRSHKPSRTSGRTSFAVS